MRTSNTAQRLKELMQENNYRQVDILNKCMPFCEKYGIKLGRNDLSQYVNGKVEPGQEKLSILGMALNVNEAWLMGYDVAKNRGQIIVSDHQALDEAVLYAISILAEESGYTFGVFAKQYQLSTNDYIIKLSPNEVKDYANSSIDQIRYVTECIIKNKLNENIIPISQDRFAPIAAHEDNPTPEEVLNANRIMEDDSEWE